MLASLKSKLLHVKQDVTASIKAVTHTQFGSTRLETHVDDKIHHGEHVVVAGNGGQQGNESAQELLHNYETVWEEIHDTSCSNLSRGKEVYKEGSAILTLITKNEKVLSTLEFEMEALPGIKTQLSEMMEQLDDINNQFSAIEHGLAHLENITEEISLEKLKETELRRFLAFESQKKRELDFLSAQLAQEQEKKMLELEMKEAKLRRTKELFYQKAFEEDMKQYKAEQMRRQKQGKTTLISLQNLATVENGKTQSILSDLILEPSTEEKENLEQFLGSAHESSAVGSDKTPQKSMTASTVSRVTVNTASHITESAGQLSDDSLEWDEAADHMDLQTAALHDSDEPVLSSELGELDNSVDLSVSPPKATTKVDDTLDE